MRDTGKIVRWLNAHPLINIRALERHCKIPQAALSKAMAGNTTFLAEKHLPALQKELKGYGYK